MARMAISMQRIAAEQLRFIVVDAGGSSTTIPIAADDVRSMYDGLVASLSGIYAQFEDVPVDDPGHSRPVAELSNRVPTTVLDAFRSIMDGPADPEPPTMLIAPNDPFPWEMVRPAIDRHMLGQAWDVARFSGPCRNETIDVSALLVIAPVPRSDPNLCDVGQGTFRDQHTVVKGHFPADQCVLLDCHTATRAEVIRQLRDDQPRVIHYMGHHFHDSELPERSLVQLAGDDVLRPMDVRDEVGPSPTGPKWPWVFLNCCKGLAIKQSGDPFEDDGSRQWGGVLRKAGARATVGPYWRVKKDESFDAAESFYGSVVRDKHSLGSAMRVMRQKADPSTLLAYTLVGDPTMKVAISSR